MAISVLRLGHRIVRDQRITTHCALVARALGAKELYYTGQHDQEMEDSVRRVAEQWGGPFSIQYRDSHRPLLKQFRGNVAHLTVYGLPFQRELGKIKKARDLLVVVGGEKVPAEIYQQADWNVAVGSQPHSEVAALAILLYELQGRRLKERFREARLSVVPQERGKVVKTHRAHTQAKPRHHQPRPSLEMSVSLSRRALFSHRYHQRP